MDKQEFCIGKAFYTATGKWRCTDIGSRVIVAIQLLEGTSENVDGPPYVVAEYVFDEYDIAGCSLDAGDFQDARENLAN